MSNKLAVVEKAEQLQAALLSYEPANYNLLLPTTDLRFIADDHRIIINTVRLDPNDDFWPVDANWQKVNGQWQQQVQGYALSKRGLRRLMHISGASVTESQIRYDEDGRVHAQATVQMTMADGLTRQFVGNYTWDTPARIEEAEQRYQEKAEREPAKKAKHRQAFESDRHRIIKFATSLAETGAINRALRDALTTKNKYTPEEIQRPFVCLQVVEPRRPEIDFSHPAIRQLMSMAMLNTGHLPNELYQSQQPKLWLRPQNNDGIDPMSDAVAAGEVQAEQYRPKEDFGEGQPAIVEEMEIDEQPREPKRHFANAQPVIVEEIEIDSDSRDPRDWKDRPLEPEELRRRMNLRPGDNKPVTQEVFRKYHAAMSTLTNGDDDKRHRIQQYVYGAETSNDLVAWQVGRLYLWVGTTRQILDEEAQLFDWVPSKNAVEEMRAIVRAHRVESGQLDLFGEREAEHDDESEEPT